MKMKIGILTFHCADNYGAVLQAYGLQEYLKSLGHEVYVLDYRPAFLLNPYKVYKFKWNSNNSYLKNIFFFIRSLLVIPIRKVRSMRFKKFRQTHLNLYGLSSENGLSNFDAFITGSDQIWNPAITYGYDTVYFGQFPAANGKKVIAYAASAGSVSHLVQDASKWQNLLSCYNAVSVREKSLACFLKEQIGKSFPVVVDPVLLCDKSVFTSIFPNSRFAKPYLLVFQLMCDSDSCLIGKIAERIANEKGLELKYVVPMSDSLKNRKLLTKEKPETFLSLIKNAAYVVTSSFHGTVFSVLFERDFTTVQFNLLQSERMVSFLEDVGLSSRLTNDLNKINTEKIDYIEVDKRLEALRAYSRTFLEKALL